MHKDKTIKDIIGHIIGILLIAMSIVLLAFMTCVGIWTINYKSNIEHNKLIHIDTAINIYDNTNGIKIETKEFSELYLSNWCMSIL